MDSVGGLGREGAQERLIEEVTRAETRMKKQSGEGKCVSSKGGSTC